MTYEETFKHACVGFYWDAGESCTGIKLPHEKGGDKGELYTFHVDGRLFVDCELHDTFSINGSLLVCFQLRSRFRALFHLGVIPSLF